MVKHRQYSDRTNQELRRILERERQRPQYRNGEVQNDLPNAAREVRWVRTTTNVDNPTYPTAPANKFVVEFGEYDFDDLAVGNETVTFVPYEPAQYRIALSHVGWLPEDITVRATLHHGKWHIMPDQFSQLKGKVTESPNIAVDGSGEVTIWINGAVTTWTVTAYLDWIATEAVAVGTEVIITWFATEQHWVITNAGC